MRRTLSFLLAGFLLAGSSAAYAITGNVTFGATVGSTCLLVVVNGNGTMVPDANLTHLDSHLTGGVPGVVSVTTTGGVSLSVDPTVSGVVVPVADTTTTTWTPSFVGTLPTFAETSSPRALTLGTYAVGVNLIGAKSGSNTFAAGNYTAVVTVRCE